MRIAFNVWAIAGFGTRGRMVLLKACRPSLLDWRYFTYEAVTPQLANPLRDASSVFGTME